MRDLELKIQPLAEDDIAQAYFWYEQQRSSLGIELLDAIDACYDVLR